MKIFLCLSLAITFAIAPVFAAEPTAPWPLPAITGDAAGVLTTPGLPEVRWRITTAPATVAGLQRLLVEVQADGLKLSGEADLDPVTHDGLWRLTAATVDAAIWLPAAAEKSSLGPLKGFTFTGTIVVTGAGLLHAGVPDGALAVTLRDGTFTLTGPGVTFEGVAADLHLDGLHPLRAPTEQTITFRTAHASGITLADGHATFSLPDETTLKITQVAVQVLGGRVVTDPFTVALTAPAAEVRARFEQIDLAQARAFLPPGGVAEASGSVSGRIDFGWAANGGLSVGEARVRVGQNEAAPVFRFEPSPGLLSGKMPPKISLLPAWLGPLARGASVPNPVYDALHEIELGRTPLRIETLRASVRPRDGGGQSVRLELLARPQGPSVVSEVNFDFTVNGPLEEILQHVLQLRSSLQNR